MLDSSGLGGLAIALRFREGRLPQLIVYSGVMSGRGSRLQVSCVGLTDLDLLFIRLGD